MAYTARQLVSKAYFLSGIVGREFQTVSGSQLADGMFLLNDLLAEKTGDLGLIPFFKEYSLTAIPGQEKYFIPNLVSASTMTFVKDNVRYSTSPVDRDLYFGSAKALNVNSLPYRWHVERSNGGSDLYMVFTPDLAYPIKVWGKFAPTSDVTASQDLLLSFERGYLVYLRYALAQRMCHEFRYPWSPESDQKLKSLEYQFRNISPQDLTIKKISTFGGDRTLSYADVNLGRGWTPI